MRGCRTRGQGREAGEQSGPVGAEHRAAPTQLSARSGQDGSDIGVIRLGVVGEPGQQPARLCP